MKRFRRVCSLVLVMVLCLGLAPSFALAAMQSVKITQKGQVVDSITFNGVTVNAIYAPPNSISGYNSDPTYCCAAFVSKFYRQVYGIGVGHLSRKYNGPYVYSGSGSFAVTTAPQVGDIVWRKTDTSTHWAIVKAVGDTDVTVIEQNAWYSRKNGTARVGKTYSKTDPNVTFYHYNLNTTGATVTFSNYQVRKLTETSAEPYATATATNGKVARVGMFIGESENSMIELGTDNGTPKAKKNMWYNTTKYGYPLEPGTTYYYQPYAEVNGKRYDGDVNSFTTPGEKYVPEPEPEPIVTPEPDPDSVPPTPSQKPSEPTYTALVTCNADNLNVRKGPGTNYDKVGSLKRGSKCTVYPNKASGGWSWIEGSGISGYVSTDRLTTFTGNTRTGVVTCNADVLNVRKGPGTSYDKVGQIPNGASCTVYLDVKADWYFVTYGNIAGYASKNKITLK